MNGPWVPHEVMVSGMDATRQQDDASQGTELTDPFYAPLRRMIEANEGARAQVDDIKAQIIATLRLNVPEISTYIPKYPVIPSLYVYDDLTIRTKPFDYDGHDNGNAIMIPNAQAGGITIAGRSGHIDDATGGQVVGNTWIGIGFSSSPQQRWRAGIALKWHYEWTLGYSGFPDGVLGSNPWAGCRGGVNLQAYDEHGAVTPLATKTLFNPPNHSGVSKVPVEIRDSDDGLLAGRDLEVYFDAGPVHTRWINAIAWIDMNTHYSGVMSLAWAFAVLNVSLVFISVGGPDTYS
jgi:hypothetical protein